MEFDSGVGPNCIIVQITDQQGETKYNYQQGKYQNFHNVSIYIETLHNLQIKMKRGNAI